MSSASDEELAPNVRFPQVLLSAHAAAVAAAAGAVTLLTSSSGAGTVGIPSFMAPEAALALREAALAEYRVARARHIPPLLQV